MVFKMKLCLVKVACIVILLASCINVVGKNNGGADMVSVTNETVKKVHPSLLDDNPFNDTTEYTTDVINEFRDTLVGNFTGKGVDTLIAEPYGLNTVRKNFKIYSKNGSVKPLFIEEIFCVNLLSEDDLDGNGTEEFGIMWHLEMGNWNSYYVFTYLDDKWQLLIRPLCIYNPHFYDELKVVNAVKPSKEGYVTGAISHGGEDFYIEYKEIPINPTPIPQSTLHF